MASRSTAFRRRLLRILEQHGLTAAAAQAVRAWGVKLRDEALRDPSAERAVMLDAETGEVTGPMLTGQRDQVQLGPVLRVLWPGRRYVCVHSHPADASFSPYDVGLPARYRDVPIIVAVAADGTWYIGSLDPERPAAAAEDVFITYNETYDALLPEYQRATAERRLTRRQAVRAHTHEVWETARLALGLRYDRVESGKSHDDSDTGGHPHPRAVPARSR